MKQILFLLILISTFCSCGKSKIDTCLIDSCDEKRLTVMTATKWSGTLGYYNDLRKWAVNIPIPNTVDGIRTCIICIDIPDSLKLMGRIVTISGELKESCNYPFPQVGGQEIYYVNPTYLK